MNRIHLKLCLIAVTALAPSAKAGEQKYKELDPSRIDAVAAMLPDEPAGFGPPCTDRAAWNDPALRAALHEKEVTAAADKLLAAPFPAWDDALYLEFSKIGRRPPGEQMLRRREAWLYPLVVAECLEDRGRFVDRIDLALNEYAGEKTWTLPAHDAGLTNFSGKAYSVDLRSSAFSHQLAEALYLLGDKVSPKTRARVLGAIETRVFAPVRRSLETGKGNFWLTTDNNWNAVCLAGVTGAALSAIPDRADRGLFVAAAERYSRHYMAGYTDDGYCSEGTGYWNYGFTGYTTLREELVRATGGRLDLFSDPKIRYVAMFGLRIQMTDGAVPCFGDCPFGASASADLVRYCDRVLGLGAPIDRDASHPRLANLVTAMMDVFPNPSDGAKSLAGGESAGEAEQVGVVSFFDKAGVMVCRPRPGTACRLGAAVKGGGNGSHSHNDVGSFVISVGPEEPVGDPGGPRAYDNQTFGPKRYVLFKSLNSFGHPVPVVAGKLQRPATQAKPKVLSTRFTDAGDDIEIDIASAYDVPELKKLVRTFRYDRQGAGSVTVEDAVEFTTPQAFEAALPTHGQWTRTGPRTIEFATAHAKLVADVDTPDGFELTSEKVEELGALPFTRLGLKLSKPVTSAVVRITFRPEALDGPRG